MPRVEVDWARCQNYGQCIFEAPRVFRFDADDKLEFDGDVTADDLEAVEAAADICPMRAISITP